MIVISHLIIRPRKVNSIEGRNEIKVEPVQVEDEPLKLELEAFVECSAAADDPQYLDKGHSGA